MKTLREAKVVVPGMFPGRVTDETTRERYAFERKAADAFGGLTRTMGYGIDPTTPKGEEVWVYTIAMYPLPDNDATLVQLACEVWRATDQQFGYMVLADGDVVFVDVARAFRTGLVPLPHGRLVPVSPSVRVTSENVAEARL